MVLYVFFCFACLKITLTSKKESSELLVMLTVVVVVVEAGA